MSVTFLTNEDKQELEQKIGEELTDELYSELELVWEEGAIDGSKGTDYTVTNACRTKGYIDARSIHAISTITSKHLFAYDADHRYLCNSSIPANTTLSNADIFALNSDIKYIRMRSKWGENTTSVVGSVKVLIDKRVKNTCESVDVIDKKFTDLTIGKYPMEWKQGYIRTDTGEYGVRSDTVPMQYVYGEKLKISAFIKAETGNLLYFRIFAYAEDGTYLGFLNNMARGGMIMPNDILAVYPTTAEILLQMYYGGEKYTPVSDVEQYTSVYALKTLAEQKYIDKINQLDKRQRFNDKPIMVAYSHGAGLGHMNTECAYVNAAIAGFRWLKADVQPTSDGKLVMCHDDGFTFDSNGYITTYNANSENTRLIHDMTYAECMASEYAITYHTRTDLTSETEIKEIYRPKVCDLERFLLVCKEFEVRPYIVIRNDYMDVVVPELLRLLEAYDFTDNCIVNSFALASVQKVAEQSNHRVMISVVSEYPQGTALTKEKIDNLLTVSPNCTINIYTGSKTAEWNNELLAEQSSEAIAYAKSLGVVVGTAFVSEPHTLFSKGIGLMQCDTVCIQPKVTTIPLCVSLLNGVATVEKSGVYGSRYTADVQINGPSLYIYNVRLIGSDRDFADGITPNLASALPYTLTVVGDNIKSTSLLWNSTIQITFDTDIADIDTSSEKKIYVKFAYGV